MKRNVLRTIFFFALMLSFAAAVSAQDRDDHRACALPNIAGQWGYAFTGTVFVPPTGTPLPVAAIGKATISAEGDFSATQSYVRNGQFFDETVKGTLTLNADSNCTGKLNVNVYDGTTLSRTVEWDFVIVDYAREIRMIVRSVVLPNGANVPALITGEQRKMFPAPPFFFD